MSAQDVGNAQESVDAKFEGTELTVAFNPMFLHDGIDAVDTEEIVLETVDPLEAGDAARGRQRRLPVPADAGAHVLTTMLAESATRSITRVGHLWLDDFRCLQRRRSRARSRAHGDPRRERPGQDQHARSDRVDRACALVPRRERRAARAQRLRAGDRARRDRERRPAAAVRGRDPRDRPQPRAVQQARRSHARATSTACCASRCSHPTISSW